MYWYVILNAKELYLKDQLKQREYGEEEKIKFTCFHQTTMHVPDDTVDGKPAADTINALGVISVGYTCTERSMRLLWRELVRSVYL